MAEFMGSQSIDAEIDAALSSGQARSGVLVRFSEEGGALSGSGPKLGQGDVWYHDNLKVPGARPSGETVQIRVHSPNPKAPEGTYSHRHYTIQINMKKGLYRLPNGTWKMINYMTPDERAAAHYPAGN